MDGLVFATLGLLIFIIYIKHRSDSLKQESHAVQTQQNDANQSVQRAMGHLRETIDRCHEDHGGAIDALIFMAASDGTVSRQELRIIIGFCERQGTQVGKEWESACDMLNTGINMRITGGESAAVANIESVTEKPVHYRAAFLGAAEAIVASNRTTNATKRRLLEQVRALI